MAGRNGKSKECRCRQEAARQQIILDPEDEHWRAKCYVSSHGYVILCGSRGKTSLHRVLTNCPDGLLVDHLNGNPLDNHKANLRVVDHITNCHNVGLWKINTSGFKGVYQIKKTGRFKAAMAGVNLGHYITAEEANTARLLYEQEHWGIQPQRLVDFQAAGLA